MKNFKLLIIIFNFALLIFNFGIPDANAALIVQAPKYIGLTNGLVGYWSFDGADVVNVTAYDKSGQGNNGTLTNGPVRAQGKLGQGLSFDGTAYVAVNANSLPADNVAKTISYWIKFPSAPTSAAVVFQMDNGNNGTYSGFHNLTGCSGVSMGTWKWGGPFLVCTAIPATNTWHHYVYTYDTSTHRLYLNGNLITTGGGATQSTTPNEAYIHTAGEHFSGLIDDVRIYNRALSGDEIKRLYRIGATLKINTDVSRDNPDLERGLVGLWSFDGKDMAGNTAYDRSGQGNNGTLTNGPTRTIGKIGQGLSFDGVDDYVNAGRNPSLDMGANNFSVGGWIKTSGNPSAQAGNAGYGLLAAKGSSGAGGKRYGLWAYRQTSGVAALNLDDDAAEAYFEGTTNIDDGNWHMVYGVRDGNTAKIYVDGIQENTADITGLGSLDDINKDFMISVDSHAPTNYFVRGLIDDVRIYNRALTPAEIQRLYNLGR